MQELDDPKGPVTTQNESTQGHDPSPKHEPPPPFASPAESTASLSFREDSANLPAPAPFQVIGQPATQAPAPFSDQVSDPPPRAEPVIAAKPVPPLSSTPVPPLSASAAPAKSTMADSVHAPATPAASPSPAAEQRAPEQPAAEQRAAEPRTAQQPAAEQLAAEQPIVVQSAAAQPAPPPTTLEAGAAPSATSGPVVPAAPTFQAAAAEAAALEAPVAQAPATPFSAPHTLNSPPPYQGPNAGARRLQQAVDVMSRLRQRMRAQILGRDDVIDLVLVALLADGHVLLEDFPGSGKTTLAKSLGSSIINPPAGSPEEDNGGDSGIADFRRIQFTPDLLPSDVTGVSVFDVNTHRFDFRRGPIFAHVVLADEINRTSPKVQSAMLEAMAEKQVTVDNVTYPLDPLFFVIATQNPLDLAGTYPLPVAQLDRFLFKIRMHHIDRQAELEVLNTYRQRRDMERQDLPKVTRLDVLAARRAIDELVAIEQPVKECLVEIAHRLRGDERVLQGNSTRSLVLILPALQALATLRGRDFVSADDIQTLIPRVLGHRVELAPGVTDMDQVLTEVMEGPIEALSRSTLRRR